MCVCCQWKRKLILFLKKKLISSLPNSIDFTKRWQHWNTNSTDQHRLCIIWCAYASTETFGFTHFRIIWATRGITKTTTICINSIKPTFVTFPIVNCDVFGHMNLYKWIFVLEKRNISKFIEIKGKPRAYTYQMPYQTLWWQIRMMKCTNNETFCQKHVLLRKRSTEN